MSDNLVIIFILSLCFVCGCGFNEPESCNRYARKLSQDEIALVPYQVNDTVHYISNDSVSSYYFTCITRKYFEDIAEYYDKYCNNEKEKVHYSGYYYELLSNIPYFDNMLAINITLSTGNNSMVYCRIREGYFTFKIYNFQSKNNIQFLSYYTRSDDSVKIYKKLQDTTIFCPYAHGNLDFIDEANINDKVYENINIWSGVTGFFDSIYYTSSAGIIRMVDTLGNSYNINE